MPPRMLEEKLDQLYAADPADFVALRKQLQAELRAAGNKPEAALLGRSRRPSTAMWAVNQLVRRRPELVDALLERGDELRTAHSGDDRAALRDAIRAHRTAVADAAAAALDVVGPPPKETLREEISSVLRAASSQPEFGRELRVGRLVRSDVITPGFPEFAGFGPESSGAHATPGDAAPRRSGAVASKEPARKKAPREAEKRAAEREARLKLERALREEASANAAIDAAQHRVDELGKELASARSAVRDARSRARKARAETARLEALVESEHPSR